MTATVAVIIPTYNRAAVLARAIESALAQKVDGCEIIVVDDGSTDTTDAAVARYAGTPIRLIHQANRGPAAARNAGVRETDAAWIAFLDSDDEWLDGKLAAQLEQATAAGADWAVCGHETITSDGRRVERPAPLPRTAVDLQRQLLANEAIATDTVLVRRALFERCGGFDEALPTAEDVDLYLRLAATAPLVADPAIRCRVHIRPDGTVAHHGRIARAACRREVFARCKGHLVDRRLRRDRRAALAREALDLARLHLADGARAAAARWLVRSLPGGLDVDRLKVAGECLLGTERYDRQSARVKGVARLWR
ncbi:MAG: glycosyltransferase family 2 protein [Planctomycetota bacterium]